MAKFQNKDVQSVFDAFLAVFIDHVLTKTVDATFHEFSAKAYETLFSVAHKIAERRQDLGLDKHEDCADAAISTIEAIEKAKETVEKMVKETNSVGLDNLLRGIVDELEGLHGNAQAFLAKEEEAEEPKSEEATETPETAKE